jgi:hypothetical protein
MRRLDLHYAAAYLRLLDAVAQTSGGDRLVTLWPMRGRLYRGDLMVVGRALNGWGAGTAFWPRDARDAQGRDRVLQRTREESEGGPKNCPLAWVAKCWQAKRGYNTARSAFWRTARAVLMRGEEPSRNWSSRLCWTNLYKVAPAAGGNPEPALQRVQLAACAELLRLEVEAFQPARVLVMSGAAWFAPFADALGLGIVRRRGYVEGVFCDRGRTWVVTKHPERKPEAPLVAGAIKAFGG